MKVVGIDLSGPRNFADTCLASFEERGDGIHLQDVREGANDEQILEAISSLEGESCVAMVNDLLIALIMFRRGNDLPDHFICRGSRQDSPCFDV